MTFLNTWFQNEKYTQMAQVISSLTLGILFSPFSYGLFFLFVFMIFYEIAYYLFTKGEAPYYDLTTRASVINSYFLGYIIGRTAAGQPIFISGVPEMPEINKMPKMPKITE
jgi:hypothetical protein